MKINRQSAEAVFLPQQRDAGDTLPGAKDYQQDGLLTTLILTGPGQLEILEDRMVDCGGDRRMQWDGVVHDVDGGLDIRVTEPLRGIRHGGDRFHLPGCSETPRHGTAARLHESLASLSPGCRTITIANDSLNDYGERYSPADSLRRGFDDWAAARLRAISSISNGEEVELVGESMGNVIGALIMKRNIEAPAADIRKSIMHSSALVPTREALVRIGIKFLPHMAKDMAVETVRHPLQALGCMQPRLDMLHPHVIAGLIGQVVHLFHEGEIDEVLDGLAGQYKIGIISGKDDVLLRREPFERLQENHPSSVKLNIVDGGHANALRHRDAAREIISMSTALDHLAAYTA